MVLVYFRVPKQLATVLATAALVTPLDPVKFPTRVHR